MISRADWVSLLKSRDFPLKQDAEIDLFSRITPKRLYAFLCKLFTQIYLGLLIRNCVKGKYSASDLCFCLQSVLPF